MRNTARVVSLTCHRNTLARHRAKTMRNDVKRAVSQRMNGALAGYAVVLWTDRNEAVAYWDGAESLGSGFFEDHVNTILRRQIAKRDRGLGEDDAS